MIHTASLVHDDVLDESSVRRGQLSCYVAVFDKYVFVRLAACLITA